MRHEYSDYLVVTVPPAGSNAYFSVNGMYDPDSSIGGHQPLYFDQMSAIYRHYTVIRSHIEWEFLPLVAVAMVAVYIDDNGTVYSNINTALEHPTGHGGLYTNNPSAMTYKLKQSWSAQAAFGGDTLDNDDLQGSASGNPVEQQWFTMLMRPANGVDTVSFYLRYKIIYDAVWDELVDIATS